MSRLRLLASAAAVLALPALLAPAPAAAQDAVRDVAGEELPPVTLTGVVRDAATGEPVDQVWVHLDGSSRGVVTAADGRFVLRDVEPESGSEVIEVVFERLGYETLIAGALATPDPAPLDIRMESDPVLLEGFEVVTDRFERRRNATPAPVRVLEADRIRTTAAPELLTFLETSGGISTRPCGMDTCLLRRGGFVQPRVYLDEVPLPGGLDGLDGYPPRAVHMVEVYSGGAMIRVYSEHFMKTAARQKLLPATIF